MTNQTQLPLKDQIRNAVQSVEPSREFSNDLWNQIASQARQPKPRSLFQKLFSSPAWSAATVLIAAALIVAVVGPQKVVEAFSSLFGYLPGVGIIQRDEGVLYLAEPIVVKKDGITLTIDRAVSNSNNLTVAHHFSGLPEGNTDCIYNVNTVRLADGKTRLPASGGGGDDKMLISYLPLPKGTDHFSYIVALDETRSGQSSEKCATPAEWVIDVKLVPMPPELTLMPVYESNEIEQQPLALETPPSTSPADDSQPTAKPIGVNFSIKRVARLTDGYLVVGRVQWTEKNWRNIQVITDNIRVTDADGKNLPVVYADDTSGELKIQNGEENYEDEFSFKIDDVNFRQPLTMTISTIRIFALRGDGPSFSFDAGDDPQVGQSWKVDQELDVLGYKVAVRSVHVVESDPASHHYISMDFDSSKNPPLKGYGIICAEPPDGVISLDFNYADGGITINKYGGGWGDEKRESGQREYIIFLEKGLPTGKIEMGVESIIFQVNGAWQLQWNLPSE